MDKNINSSQCDICAERGPCNYCGRKEETRMKTHFKLFVNNKDALFYKWNIDSGEIYRIDLDEETKNFIKGLPTFLASEDQKPKILLLKNKCYISYYISSEICRYCFVCVI